MRILFGEGRFGFDGDIALPTLIANGQLLNDAFAATAARCAGPNTCPFGDRLAGVAYDCDELDRLTGADHLL